MTERRQENGWWWPLVSCPYCGAEPRLIAAQGDDRCAGCGHAYSFDGKVLQWSTVEQPLSNPVSFGSIRSRLRSLVNPLDSPLLPFRHLLRMRVEGYYRRTVTDADLARRWADHYLVDLSLPTNATVLDFGCGRGRHAGLLSQLGYRVIAQDIKPNPWWESLRGCGFQTVRDTARLPWTSEAVDMVVEVGVIHYLAAERLREHVAEVARVLKPGGYWVLLEANSRSRGAASFRRQIGNLYTLESVQRLCTDSGLTQRDLSYEAYYAPVLSVSVNIVRMLCSPPPFDLSDYDSVLARRLPPEQRGLWLLRLQKPAT
jgi:SAM-dependent methyltransferase